ncbi:MAG: histidinol-phosphate transaminase [Verrucomicrobia bacterium]|nr:histidinol-phosphate transaminase [Verrucomicrobiota bacterium]
MKRQIHHLPVYQPGKPIELVAREFGLDPVQIAKLASNENPLGAPEGALRAAAAVLTQSALYPDNSGWFLTGKLADKLALQRENFVLAAGSNEIFYLLADLFLQPGTSAVMGAHAFISYKIATVLAGAEAIEVPMPDYKHDLSAMLRAIRPDTRIVFLPNPNNPTGDLIPAEAVLEFARALPENVILCYDEAYAEYQEQPADLRPLIAEGRPIVCTRTFSKIYGLAALRIGYGYTTPELAGMLNAVRPPFNTSIPAQAAAMAALDDNAWVDHCRRHNNAGLVQLQQGLDAMDLEWVPSAGNFLLVHIKNADKVFHQLQCKGIIVRPVKGYNLPSHLRVSVGTEPQNDRFLAELKCMIQT